MIGINHIFLKILLERLLDSSSKIIGKKGKSLKEIGLYLCQDYGVLAQNKKSID